MIPNPIHRVLSTIRKNRVQALLMGGQACVLYGAAEYSRDADLAILSQPENLSQLEKALAELQAIRIAVPPFEAQYLERGHAVHFRCAHPDVERIRVDVMSKMRGVAPFEELWARRTTFSIAGDEIEAMGLGDLVQAKKTQRDKDWPMIRRLVDVNYLANRDAATPEQVDFWLREMRTPELLLELARLHSSEVERYAPQRQALAVVLQGGDEMAITAALLDEELQERQRDREYWRPLKAELERLRHQRIPE